MLNPIYKRLHLFKVIGTVFAVLLATYYLVIFLRSRCNVVLPIPIPIASELAPSSSSSPPENIRYKFERRNIKFDVASKQLFKVELEYFEYNIFPRLEERNKATVDEGKCIQPSVVETDNDRRKIIVISNFIYYREPTLKSKMITNERKATDEEVDARISEILETLRSNLKHPDIQVIHIFVENPDAIPYLLSMPLENSEKLVIKLAKEVTLTVMLKYASECFQGRTVAITNQDNLFGDGWDKLDHDILKNNKLMYALTRHPSRHLCLSTLGMPYCGRMAQNWGCHDTFVLHMNQKFTDQMLSPVANLTQTKPGMENMLIWTFKNKLGYRVTNPCLVLYVHHEHCIPMRESGRVRIKNGQSDSAPFTDSLKP